MEAAEGGLNSFTDDKEAVKFPLADRLLSVETKEDVEEDTEEVCWAGVSSEEVREEEGVKRGEAAPSVGPVRSFPFEESWGGEQEGAA